MQFNETRDSVAERTRTTNHEGGEAFDPDSAELALTKVVINNLLDDTYYESAEEQFASVEQEFERCADANPEFVLKLAKYARQEENLRQVPQALLVLAANDDRTKEYVRDYATSIMSRADEPLDVVALQAARHGITSAPLQDGGVLRQSIEDALHTYNEWQYSKWDRPNREWRYRDLLNVVHPTPRDEERERIFEKIAYGDLDDYPEVEPLTQEDTWESSLSDDSDDRSKKEKYVEQLEEGNMGLFPRIRQARDMLESGVPAAAIVEGVTDDWIRNSRLYPFRFYQAYRAVERSSNIPPAQKRVMKEFLERAMMVSTENLPDVLDDTFVAVDTSGSMHSRLSSDSTLSMVEISSLFGALVYERGADLAAFASSIEEFAGDRRNPITTNLDAIRDMPVGGGTRGYKVPRFLAQHDRDSYSQVIVFTDMQLWGGSFRDAWNEYKQQVNPDASLYLVDLNSYGDLVTPEGAEDVHNIAGWSESVIDYIDNMENVDGMIREIESVEPDR